MSPARKRTKDPAPVFAALGDTTRLKLVSRLGDGAPRSITQLADGFDVTRQAITKHLRVLEDADLVRCTRVGRETRYTLRPRSVDAASAYLERVSMQWDAAVERLRRVVEE